MRAFGRGETVARHGATVRPQELAIFVVLVVPRGVVGAVEHLGGTPKPVTTEGGFVRFALSRDGYEGE